MTDIEKLKYPIGKFEKRSEVTPELLNEWITEIATFPSKMISEVINLTEEQLNTQYRPGWMDIKTGDTPLRRQPHEQFHPLKTCSYRRSTNSKTLL